MMLLHKSDYTPLLFKSYVSGLEPHMMGTNLGVNPQHLEIHKKVQMRDLCRVYFHVRCDVCKHVGYWKH